MAKERWRIRESRETDDSELRETQQKEIEFDEFVSRISRELKHIEEGRKERSTIEQPVEEKSVATRVNEVLTHLRIKEILDTFEKELEIQEPESVKRGIEPTGKKTSDNEIENSCLEREVPSISSIAKKVTSIQQELDVLKETGVDIKNLDETLRNLNQELVNLAIERQDSDTSKKLEQSERNLTNFSKQELRHAYELENGPPEVTIESMKDVDDLVKKHKDFLDERYVLRTYDQCVKYIAIRNDWSKTQLELAEEYGISQSLVGKWRGEYEHGLVRTLRSLEEDLIVSNWAKTRDYNSLYEPIKELRKSNEETILEPLQQDFSDAKKIEPIVVREVLGKINESQLEPELLVKSFERMYQKGHGDERIFYSDLTAHFTLDKIKEIEAALREKRESIESELNRTLSLEAMEKAVRVASVEGRMYMWIQNQSKNDMLNAWASQYFYPKEPREFTRLASGALEKLGLYPERTESIEHYNKIMDQMLSDGESGKIAISRHMNDKRVQGESLRFQMDVLGLDTSYLNGRVEQITGINGQGGIKDPMFIEGTQLKYLRARLMATGNSDFHLRRDGRGEYYEESKERIEIFKQNLSEIGDVNVTIIKRKGDFKVNITSTIGNAMIFWGCPFGDKSIRNEGLPRDFMDLSEDVHQKYGEDLIVQDGAITKKGYATWVRHVAIHAGDKTDEYGFQSSIATREFILIQSKGEYDEYMDRYVLSYGSLERLTESNNPEIAEPAKNLLQVIDETPSNMIETEADIFRAQGISIRTRPVAVKYYLKTGKASVAWVAITETIEDTVKWFKSMPPNDVVKREKAFGFLKARGEYPDWSKKNPRYDDVSEQNE